MATHVEHRCPKCDEELYDVSIHSIGVTHTKCEKCETLVLTDNTPFSYKNLFGKFYTFIEIIPQTLLMSVVLGGGLFYLLFSDDTAIYIGISLYIVIAYVRLILRIQRVEDEQKDFERENKIEPVKK
jgi:hypothetical protein